MGPGCGRCRLALCFPLEGDIRVLVLAPPVLLEHVPAVVQVDVDEPLVQPLQGVLLEVPVGLVVPTADDKGLSYCNVQNMGKQLIYRDGLDNIRNTVCMSMIYVSAEI